MSAAARVPQAARSGLDVSVAFLPLQAADFSDAGWHNGGFRQYPVFADAAAHQGVIADPELDLARNQLAAERTSMDVNNPAAVARFRELLERRDTLFQQSKGAGFSELRAATDRYGARVQDYNARCAGRPMEPGLLAQAQATHACPPP